MILAYEFLFHTWGQRWNVTRRAVVSRVIPEDLCRPNLTHPIGRFGTFLDCFSNYVLRCAVFAHMFFFCIEYVLRSHVAKLLLIFIQYELRVNRFVGCWSFMFFCC